MIHVSLAHQLGRGSVEPRHHTLITQLRKKCIGVEGHDFPSVVRNLLCHFSNHRLAYLLLTLAQILFFEGNTNLALHSSTHQRNRRFNHLCGSLFSSTSRGRRASLPFLLYHLFFL